MADSDNIGKPERLDNWLAGLYNKGKFSGTVLLSKGGSIIFHKSYGYTDVDEKIRISQHSSFNLAFVSKQFAAMGIEYLGVFLKKEV